MCQTLQEGGRRCPSSSNAKATVLRQRKRLVEELTNPELPVERRRKILKRLMKNQQALLAYYRQHPVIDLPEEMVQDTHQFNNGSDKFAFCYSSEMDDEKILPVFNAENAHKYDVLGHLDSPHYAYREDEYITSVAKPVGGLWASAYDEGTQRPEWADHDAGYDGGMPAFVYDISAKSDAKILVIKTKEDYEKISDLSKRTVNGLGRGMDFTTFVQKKGIDYEKLGVDGVVVHRAAISGAGFAGSDYKYESLYGWDLTSLVVINKDAFNYDVNENVPEGQSNRYNDDYDYDDDIRNYFAGSDD